MLAAGGVLGRRWLATGFDSGFARAAGARSGLPDAALLGLIALGIVAALTAVGALLVTALVVVPAATVRLVTRRLPVWQIGSVVVTALEGVVGLWISVQTNVPPGAAIATGAMDARKGLDQSLPGGNLPSSRASRLELVKAALVNSQIGLIGNLAKVERELFLAVLLGAIVIGVFLKIRARTRIAGAADRTPPTA